MDEVLLFTKNVLLYLLFQDILFRLMKGNAMEQFVRPICGMLFVLLMLRPITSLFEKGPNILSFTKTRLSYLLAEGDAYQGAASFTENYEPIFSAYEQRLKTELAAELSTLGLFLSEACFTFSKDEENFASIQALSISATEGTKEEKEKISIAPIRIFPPEQHFFSPKELSVRDHVAAYFQLTTKQVTVTINELDNREEKDGKR